MRQTNPTCAANVEVARALNTVNRRSRFVRLRTLKMFDANVLRTLRSSDQETQQVDDRCAQDETNRVGECT